MITKGGGGHGEKEEGFQGGRKILGNDGYGPYLDCGDGSQV